MNYKREFLNFVTTRGNCTITMRHGQTGESKTYSLDVENLVLGAIHVYKINFYSPKNEGQVFKLAWETIQKIK